MNRDVKKETQADVKRGRRINLGCHREGDFVVVAKERKVHKRMKFSPSISFAGELSLSHPQFIRGSMDQSITSSTSQTSSRDSLLGFAFGALVTHVSADIFLDKRLYVLLSA